MSMEIIPRAGLTTQSRLAIVMECWDEGDALKGKAFSSSMTAVAAAQFRLAGININDCFVTAVINRPASDFEHFCGPKSSAIPGEPPVGANKYVRAEFANDLAEFRARLKAYNPTCILALGGGAAWGVCGSSRLKSYRGTPVQSPYGKCISTYSPQSINGEYKLLPIFLADIAKAKRESAFPDVRRPDRLIYIEPSIVDLANWNDKLLQTTTLSVDIETAAGQITCVGFAPNKSEALVVPFVANGYEGNNYWQTLSQELSAWHYVRTWCRNAKKLVGQNFNYDMGYLWRTYGIALPVPSEDTMLMHHALQIEMEKGLGFLGSIYTDEPSWKLMRANRETLKKED
jgi:hypothetical protein